MRGGHSCFTDTLTHVSNEHNTQREQVEKMERETRDHSDAILDDNLMDIRVPYTRQTHTCADRRHRDDHASKTHTHAHDTQTLT